MDYSGYDNKNIVLNELIGLRVRVVRCIDKKQRGLEGRVVDETKNTLVVETEEGRKKDSEDVVNVPVLRWKEIVRCRRPRR